MSTTTNTTNKKHDIWCIPQKILLRPLWIIGWCILLVIGFISVYDVSLSTCGDRYPILLSRALTTDPYRGIILSYCLLSICTSFSLQKSFLFGGFLGFFSAFLVSMFETSAHNFLIVTSSVLILFECMPQKMSDKLWENIWKFHWFITMLLGFIFVILKNEIGKCSFWYIVEYILFLSMFLLVTWLIPPTMELTDTISKSNTINESNIENSKKVSNNFMKKDKLNPGKFKMEF
jgi:hypothetical protein